MLIEDRFFEQEWVQDLCNEDFRMLLYLLHASSRKTGILELNMRQLNFMANTGCVYTKEDVYEKFGRMIKPIKNRPNSAIFADYIRFNWCKSGKPIDTIHNPLFKAVVKELADYGLTIADINKMSGKEILIKDEDVIDDSGIEDDINSLPKLEDDHKKELNEQYEMWFNDFWKMYPSNCPRKVDKKKCHDKFIRLVKNDKDPEHLFQMIMGGLNTWCESDMWQKDNGQFIKAPLVWLNGSCWNDKPMKGNSYGDTRKHITSNTNYNDTSANNIF